MTAVPGKPPSSGVSSPDGILHDRDPSRPPDSRQMSQLAQGNP